MWRSRGLARLGSGLRDEQLQKRLRGHGRFPGRLRNRLLRRDASGDNHLVADLALAWIAAGAKREGLRLKRTARLSQKLDASAVVLHDAHDEASNLWGAFDRARRNLPRIRLHFACKGL